MKHKHHIIPKHMGGNNDPENLIELTVEEHAEAHKELWEYCGHWEDYLAWQALLGRIPKEKIAREASRLANIGNTHGKSNKGRKLSSESKKKISEGMKGNKNGIFCKGRIVTEEHRKKISDSLKGRKDSPETRERKRRAHLKVTS